MKHLGKRLLAAGLSAAMVLGSVGAVGATTVDDVDCTGWWAAFTDGIGLDDGDSVEVTFTNTTYSTASSAWNTPIYVIYSGDGTVNGTDYVEYCVHRSDNYGWGDGLSTTTSYVYPGWDTWLAANKEGMDYTVSASRSGDEVTVTASDEYGVVNEFVVTVASGKTAYISLSGEECVLSNISYTYASADAEITFLGGSLNMSDTSTYTTTGLRFGYTVEIPDGVDYDSISATWNWGTDADNLTAFTPSTLNYVNNGDGTITTNLVITDVTNDYYETTIYSELVLTYELDGVTYTVTDTVQSRTVDDVATAISGSSLASDEEQAYAAGILAN